jgi:hypothetical protein
METIVDFYGLLENGQRRAWQETSSVFKKTEGDGAPKAICHIDHEMVSDVACSTEGMEGRGDLLHLMNLSFCCHL